MALAKRLMVMVMLIFWIKGAMAHGHGMKKKAVSVYFSDIFNVTSVMVAQPEATVKAGPVTPTQGPFGAMFLMSDPIMEGPDPASAQLGNMSVTLIFCQPPYGGNSLANWVLTFFNNSLPHHHPLHGLHGTLSVSGLSGFALEPQPITGGTGSFAFAVGSLTVAPLDVYTFHARVRINLLLYWPPYAPAAALF